jgi:UDP-N-acetyl-D-glucosamine dehydrogenase
LRAVAYDVGIIGAGYVGLPLAATFAESGCRALLVDVVQDVVDALNRGESHIEDVASDRLGPLVEQGLIRATSDYADLKPMPS